MNRMEQASGLPGSRSSDGRPTAGRVRLLDCVVEVDLDRVVAPHGVTTLEPKVMAVLAHLIDRAGAVVSTDELVAVVWRGRPMGDNPVYRCIAQLRRALGDNPRAPRFIATIPTKGYRLLAAVEPADAEPATVVAGPARRAARSAPDASPPAAPAPRPAVVPARWLLLALLLVLPWRDTSRASAVVGAAAVPTLTVLPLRATTGGAADMLLARAMGELLQQRLARLPGVVVQPGRAPHDAFPAAAGGRIARNASGARFVLDGDVAHGDGRLALRLRLLDGRTGQRLWSTRTDRPLREAARMRDGVARALAAAMGLPRDAVHSAGADTDGIDLDAYATYLRGRDRLQAHTAEDRAAAIELFRRATILAPGFARAYVGLGEALAEEADAGSGPAAGLRNAAAQAFDRALQLDPALGEAWIGRARSTRDPARAEADFRRGLALAPGDASGHMHFARFLFGAARPGEAIAAVERARHLDPRSPGPCLLQAFLVMVARSDVAGHDRLVREALRIEPDSPDALYQLAYSLWEYSGRFAEAAVVAERAIAADPQALPARLLARDIYLDLGDPAAAIRALGPSPDPATTMQVAQYRGDVAGAADALNELGPSDWPDAGPQASHAQAIRDAGLQAGNLAPAVARLRAVDAAQARGGDALPMWHRGFALAYAHTLVLAGDGAAGRRRAQAMLAVVDTHGIGRAPHWFCRERASAYAILGDDGRVLEELAHCIRNGQVYRWWYLAGHDPLYAHLRGDARFHALDRAATAHRDRQRALHAALQREDAHRLAVRVAGPPVTGSVRRVPDAALR